MRDALKEDLSESDYFKLCHDIIDDHGWQQFFSGDDGKQQLFRVPIASLEPRALREEVERTVRFQARAAKSDEVILHDLVLEKALDREKNYQNQRRAKRDRSDGNSGRAPKRGPSKSSTKKPRLTTERSTSSSKPPTKKTSSERAKVPPTPCPHCDEMHWLSECSTASDDQKAEIRRKLREQRANDGNKGVVARMKRLRECIPSQEKTVLLNEELAVPYCADTGADRTAISKQHVTQLLRSDTSIKVTPLDTPTVHVAVGDHEVISTHFVRLRLRLNTAAGPVGLQKPVFFIV
ncbi:hypothetical protein PPTG_11602 [Phytophthora nicotianae INRA-310]|uniref:Uncharacterized protein n=1 Tax=Phytophthora nicotianae (strain INRA-310) TaxID=761204 RepID=W2Q6H3_PHYN3|nr:hypothetical protein PPTG_11602 [Phytophthora nicotianae INRA-310]ETN08773.1 hypothetical protein PPTG_11602 [Phytophthora nicotianae INRA-310]